MGKQKLEPWQIEDAARLKAIYTRKKRGLGLTQEKLAVAIGASHQSGASNYLNAETALGIRVALIFARELQVDVSEFSPTLAAEIGNAAGGALMDIDKELIEIAGQISPESQQFLISVARTLRDKESSGKKK